MPNAKKVFFETLEAIEWKRFPSMHKGFVDAKHPTDERKQKYDTEMIQNMESKT